MADVLTPAQRRLNMSRIADRDTKPEMLVRMMLHRAGYRFRLHRKDLPGKPDLTLAKYRAVIFVHGCFWHQHGCHLTKMPGTSRDFWEKKLSANIIRDQKAISELQRKGWRTLTIWECALRGKERIPSDQALRLLEQFLRGTATDVAIEGLSESHHGLSTGSKRISN